MDVRVSLFCAKKFLKNFNFWKNQKLTKNYVCSRENWKLVEIATMSVG
jgi:hypothetical protein